MELRDSRRRYLTMHQHVEDPRNSPLALWLRPFRYESLDIVNFAEKIVVLTSMMVVCWDAFVMFFLSLNVTVVSSCLNSYEAILLIVSEGFEETAPDDTSQHIQLSSRMAPVSRAFSEAWEYDRR